MKEMFKLMKKYRWYALITPILVTIEVATAIVIPMILSSLINNGVNTGDMDYILRLGLIIIGFATISLIVAISSMFTGSKAAHGFGTEIRDKMYKKINNFSFANMDKFSTPTLLTRLTNDIEKISRATMMSLRMAIRAPLMLVSSAFMTFRINKELTFLVLAVVPFIIVIAGIVGRFVRPIFMRIQRKIDDINRVVQENIKGIRVIKTYTLEDEEIKKFGIKNEALKKIFVKVVFIMNLLEPLFSLIISAAAVLVLYFGGKLVVGGKMLQGDLIAFITYSMQILFAFLMLSGFFIHILSSTASFTRVREVLETEPSIKEKNNPLTEFKNFNVEFKDVCFAYDSKAEEQKNPIMAIMDNESLSEKEKKAKIKEIQKERKLKKKLEKEELKKNKKLNKDKEENQEIEKDICEVYEENKTPMLKNINFKVNEGETLGIIGPTGSGKTTISNLLLRFYDIKKGEILIGGENIKEYSLNSINDNLSLVQQKNTLIKGTIRENLLMAKPNATDEEMENVLKIAQAYNFVSEYEDFIDHEVLTAGQNFSGGQKQRLTIARALLKDFNILIIDDSTSALDYNTERKLQEAIKDINKIKNRNSNSKITKIIISQRINSVKDCDNILVLENGMITAQGKHDDLVTTSDFYKEIFIEQGGSHEI